jgi:hypothetical protein
MKAILPCTVAQVFASLELWLLAVRLSRRRKINHRMIIKDRAAVGSKPNKRMRIASLMTLVASMLGAGPLCADSIPVPNGSFESQSGVGQPFGVNILIDSWQKLPNPGIPEGGSNNFYWVQTAGMFVGTAPNSSNPYTNLDGTQAAYVLSFPGAGIFQDSQSADWSGATNGLNAIYKVGSSYDLTVGLFGKGMVDNYSSLQLSFYYRDGANIVTVGTPTTVTFNSTTFNPAGPFTLIDYSVNLPAVQASDAWANKNIGIEIASVQGTGAGYWDMDNVRLSASVPEPGTLVLAALGLGGVALIRWRSRRRG